MPAPAAWIQQATARPGRRLKESIDLGQSPGCNGNPERAMRVSCLGRGRLCHGCYFGHSDKSARRAASGLLQQVATEVVTGVALEPVVAYGAGCHHSSLLPGFVSASSVSFAAPGGYTTTPSGVSTAPGLKSTWLSL